MINTTHIPHVLAARIVAAFVLLCALPACHSDEPAPAEPREITFSAADGSIHLSRDGNAPLDQADTMYVTGLYHHNNKGFYYITEKIFNRGANGQWTAPDHVYYPLTGKMDFVAFASKHTAPYNPIYQTVNSSGASTMYTDDDAYISNITLDYTTEGHRLDGSDDLLASVGACGVTCPSTEPVAMNFQHLMARVRVTFIADNQATEDNMAITDVNIYNTHLSGKVQLSRTSKTDDAWAINWTNLTTLPTATEPGENPPPSLAFSYNTEDEELHPKFQDEEHVKKPAASDPARQVEIDPQKTVKK